MNSREPIDMAKWAITLLLLCLVISATTAFFYTLYDNTDQRIDSMQKATTSSQMDRLRDLRDMSDANIYDIDKLPLCTNIVSALTEFNEEDLLYITIVTPEGDSYVFTYTGTNLSSLSNVYYSDIPVTEACKLLLPYSDCRCQLVVGTVDPENPDIVDPSGLTAGLTYIQVFIKKPAVATGGV